jgi:hypothetical protein
MNKRWVLFKILYKNDFKMKTICLFARFITLINIKPFNVILFNIEFTEYCPLLSRFLSYKIL